MQVMRAFVQLCCMQFLTFSCYNSITLAGEFAASAIEAGCKEPGFTCIIDANECDKMKLICCDRMPVEEIAGMNTLRCPMPTPTPSNDGIPTHSSSNEPIDTDSGLSSRAVFPLSYTLGPISASTVDVAAEVHPGDDQDNNNSMIGNVENTPSNLRSPENQTPKILHGIGLFCVGALVLVLAVLIKSRRNIESQTPKDSYVYEPNDNLPPQASVDYRPSTEDNMSQSKSFDSTNLSKSQVEKQDIVLNESALKPVSSSLSTSLSERSTSPFFAKQSIRASASGRPNGYVDEENMSFPL